MQIIVVLRHPVERAYSHYVMMQNWGRMPIRAVRKGLPRADPRQPQLVAEPYDAYGWPTASTTKA